MLTLVNSINLSLFFEHFAVVTEVPHLMTRPSWPALLFLGLRGAITRRSSAERGHSEDQFLKCVGRATRRMPKLQAAVVTIENPRGSGVAEAPVMIIFGQRSFFGEQNDTDDFLLKIDGHTPSSSAVNVWKDARLYTNRTQLAVIFRPAFSRDENGEPRERSWHTWEG